MLARDNLKEVYEKYNLKSRENIMVMINDSGLENYSVTKQFIGSVQNMTQYLANKKKQNQWINNMIEALFCKIKKFARVYEYKGLDGFVKKIEDIKELCNDKIPIAATGGRTPNEAFEGIDPFSGLKENLIQQSKTLRVAENKNGNCF